GAVRDPWYFRGYYRNKATLANVLKTNHSSPVYANFVNAGFMVISQEYLNKSTYKQLLIEIKPSTFEKLMDQLADEPILNRYFENQWEILPPAYNVPVHL